MTTATDSIQFGACGGPDIGGALRNAGFDFVELNVQRDLLPEQDSAAFEPMRRKIDQCPLPCTAANCFVPGHLKITGPDMDMGALTKYVETACGRAARVGIEAIVFGSGGARQIPDGVGRDQAYGQLLDFGRMAAGIAHRHGVTIVVEPLNRSECNVFNSVRECGDYVRELDHSGLRLLVDAYHVARDNDRLEDIVEYGDLIRHVHIATYASRLAPGGEDCDFAPFFGALKQCGYSGRISIEGGWADLAADAGHAYQVLTDAWAEA